jgi:hypothetical protein
MNLLDTSTIQIPKILFQTDVKKPEPYVINKVKSFIDNDYKYYHFDDNEIIEFFKNNKLDDFPDIIQKFNNMPSGAHKADLFRYYFLYINGGIFMDSDAMLTCNIKEIVRDYSFFSVCSKHSKLIFQGFIGATPKNLIIYRALIDTYNIDIIHLRNNYFLLCENMYNIIFNYKYDFKYKLYNEHILNDSEVATIDLDNHSKLILIHYYRYKKIPF